MIDDEDLEQRVQRLLSQATHAYRGNRAAAGVLEEAATRLAEPLRVVVAGTPNSGKSTLVNALIGEDVAPAAPTDGPSAFTSYQDGPAPRAWWFAEDQRPHEVAMVRTTPGLRLSTGAAQRTASGATRRAVIEWPSRTLRRTRLIDTGRLEARDVFREADAVLYLTTHLDDADLSFLWAGRGLRGPSVFPVHTIVVLSRADATSGGRADAMLTARQLARRRRREPRVGTLCQDVIAVSPLVGHAARTLREEEFRVLAELAAWPRASLEPHLLSVDRFTAPGALPGVTAEQRDQLVRRLGLGGLRLAVTLTRTGCATRAALAEKLQEYSGLKDLQSAVAELFTTRRAALKARSALTVLDQLLRTEPAPGLGEQLAEIELLSADLHPFRELRLLSALRSGRVDLAPESAADARRLLGGTGTSVGERLGMPAEASTDDIYTAAYAAAERWRQESHRPDTSAAQRRAAAVVLRSCDMIIEWLAGTQVL
ncbi:GTPase [Actinoplanes sp. NBRC 103695]|uniref:GTPase n=1 Tax=Actinoplanes sp. NBRC 103695 TaxID=3032202 RepID=UPI0024A4D7A6|nr:GTPase [Actinoplanes sp. NBRC 103695]GLY94352.1 GTPase [Actinoplanes sp. NBRC 103695]